MWPRDFSERLESWAQLRQQCRRLDSEPALTKINQWWFQTPWTAYHLHWDDQQDWPDAWQLLSDKVQVLHVNGHVGVQGNELADRLSMLAIRHQVEGFGVYDGGASIAEMLAMASG